jgi:hypothetical protein
MAPRNRMTGARWEAPSVLRLAVERRIRAAFAGVTLGGGICLRQAQVIVQPGSEGQDR